MGKIVAFDSQAAVLAGRDFPTSMHGPALSVNFWVVLLILFSSFYTYFFSLRKLIQLYCPHNLTRIVLREAERKNKSARTRPTAHDGEDETPRSSTEGEEGRKEGRI
jgi:hypothetical protein